MLSTRDHVIMARAVSTGTIAGATVGAAFAVILMLICTLPFLLKFRRKRRLREQNEKNAPRLEAGMASVRPASQVFPPHLNRLSHISQSRLASAAATLSDHDSQTGKEYGHDGITYHRSAAPSPALVDRTMRSCSPAPSIALGSPPSLAEAYKAASQKNSPALVQAPFSPPPEKEIGRSPTFGTMTTEPQPMSRSATESLHGSPSPTIGDTFRKIHNKVFHRGSTRSSGSGRESRGTGSRSPDIDMDEPDLSQTLPGAPNSYLVDDKPVMGGLAEEYYSGEPFSPPEEDIQIPAPPEHSQLLHMIMMPGVSMPGVTLPDAQKTSRSTPLGSPFNPSAAPPSPTSPFVKEDESGSDDGGKETAEAKSPSLSPVPGSRGLPIEQSPIRPPPSPSHPAPGTVNPMEMMKPSTAAEQAAWVDTELWKMENSPSPRLDDLPPPQLEPSPPPQSGTFPLPTPSPQQQQEPSPPTEIPPFQAVVRHPTQMDLTVSGQTVPHHEEQIITDISDTSSPGPGFDQYGYGPSPSNHTSPDSRLTESAYTGSPSPRSSISNRRASSNADLGTVYLETSPGDHSRPASSQGDGSPKPTSFPCEICGSTFDQVHKLNHHKRYHERPHQCTLCDKRFGTKTHLDRHVNDKHNKTRKYHCTMPGCAYAKQGGGKSFPRKDNWRRHMQNKHSVQNPPEPVEEDVVMQGA